MSTKCWLHGETAPKEQNKPLKEHPGWPDRTKDFQENLAIILALAPKKQHIKPYRWYDFQVLAEERDLLVKQKELSKTLEKQVKSLLDKELDLEKFKEQVLILKDLFTKADLPNTFALLLESWEELVRINHIFDNLGQRPFSDNKESSSSESKNDDDSDNDSESEKTKQQEEERERLAREKAEAEITKKDDRITQLYKLFQGTATIFQKQHNYVDQLKEKLEKEKQNKGISQEQEEHLRADIERLENEKNELTERIEELRVKEELLKELRDKELVDLRQQKTELENKHKEFIRKLENRMGEEGNIPIPSEANEEEATFTRLDWIIKNLKNWKNQFPNQTPQEVQTKFNKLKEKLDKRYKLEDFLKWIKSEVPKRSGWEIQENEGNQFVKWDLFRWEGEEAELLLNGDTLSEDNWKKALNREGEENEVLFLETLEEWKKIVDND